MVATRSGKASGPVDEALAALGLQRNIAAVVSSFHSALAVARGSDLVALVPASFLDQQRKDAHAPAYYAFELPVKTASITVSQMWHPRSEASPAHRWLRQLVRATLAHGGAAA